ncbi:hypothetical protein KDK_38960 [Dictyobacter kobayashii]|uniref:Uncharacterized protein n=1 Tax=Dictyobacter kobayashii TaxID=2014872 RepID=A0A402ALV2_9CHLR|nr:hypothetical protein KDK_38960 [Dictyobacter kobayashii]
MFVLPFSNSSFAHDLAPGGHARLNYIEVLNNHGDEEKTMPEFPEWLAATLASDATEGQGVLPNTILPLQADACIVGPARVVLMSQDDNLSVRAAIDAPPAPGSVLVAAGGSISNTATIGG